MENQKMFKRYLLVLNNEEDSSLFKSAGGFLSLEVRDQKGKIKLNIKGIGNEAEKYIFKIGLFNLKDNNNFYTEIDTVPLSREKSETAHEFNAKEVGREKIPFDKINGVLISARNKETGVVYAPFSAFISESYPIYDKIKSILNPKPEIKIVRQSQQINETDREAGNEETKKETEAYLYDNTKEEGPQEGGDNQADSGGEGIKTDFSFMEDEDIGKEADYIEEEPEQKSNEPIRETQPKETEKCEECEKCAIESPRQNIFAIEKFISSVEKRYKRCYPFGEGKSFYRWWHIDNLSLLSNILMTCGAKTSVLYQQSLLKSFSDNGFMLQGVYQDDEKKLFLVFGLPENDEKKTKPFEACRWAKASVQSEKGVTGYWLFFVNPINGKVLR